MDCQCSILLTEDNPVNQEVGRAMLETLGCRVEVASNGLEALLLFKSNRYDLIFMDCQMPEMDGWEAAEKIREAERGRSYRTPIIALTAYMLEEEIERCRACGMDDHLGKPFRLSELSEMVTRWVRPGSGEDAPTGPAAGSAVAESTPGADESILPCLDAEALEDLKAAFGQSAESMIPAVINIYLCDSPSLLAELKDALSREDFEKMGRAAHTLKSSSANLGANVLAGLCRSVEGLAGTLSMEGAENLVRRVEAEYRRVEEALGAELNKGG